MTGNVRDESAAARRRVLERFTRFEDREGRAPTMSEYRRKYGPDAIAEVQALFGSFSHALRALDPSYDQRRRDLGLVRVTAKPQSKPNAAPRRPSRAARDCAPEAPQDTAERAESTERLTRRTRATAVVEEVAATPPKQPKPSKAPRQRAPRAPKKPRPPQPERYTRDFLAELIIGYAAEHDGRGPGWHEFKRIPGAPQSERAFERLAGSFVAFRNELGLLPPQHSYPTAPGRPPDFVGAAQQLAAELGRLPTAAETCERVGRSSSTMSRAYGSYDHLLMFAGLIGYDPKAMPLPAGEDLHAAVVAGDRHATRAAEQLFAVMSRARFGRSASRALER